MSRIGISTEALITDGQARLHASAYTELTLIVIGDNNCTSQLATCSIWRIELSPTEYEIIGNDFISLDNLGY